MKEIKLPIIRKTTGKPRVLSMDEYLKFVQYNLKHAFDKRAYARQKRMAAVDVPFVMK